jgi:hypothetical protein
MQNLKAVKMNVVTAIALFWSNKPNPAIDPRSTPEAFCACFYNFVTTPAASALTNHFAHQWGLEISSPCASQKRWGLSIMPNGFGSTVVRGVQEGLD